MLKLNMSCLKHVIFLIFLIFWPNVTYSEDAPLINITQGLVRGLVAEDGEYYMYLGIPYGVVDPGNPFGPSSPAPEFQDIYNATDDSVACPQEYDESVSSSSPSFVVSLDCLHVNIFVPRSKTTLLPVLAFIHGGFFEFGNFGRFRHGPKYIVRHDIILVTFNYRLGAYGFMCTDSPRAPGNQASKDQLLALKWVKDNIASFGGDPNRLTLSGNSAGGMLTDLIIASDEGPKYFQQAIMQSGIAFLPAYSTSRRHHFYLAEHLGFSTNNTDEALDFLSSLDTMQVISASRQLRLILRPCIERTFEGVVAFMTENWVAKKTVKANDMKILLGFNENEALGIILLPSSDLTNIVEESLVNTFVIEHEEFTGQSEVRNFFFGDEEIDHSLFKEAIDLRSDNSFVYNSMRSVQRYLKSGVKEVYLYLFFYDGERNIRKNTINTTLEGAAHADEIGYLFDVDFLGEPNLEDQLIVDRMTEMWTNFVKHGNPTPQPTTLVPLAWEPITATSPQHYIHIDSDLHLATSPYNERMAFWGLFFELNGHLQQLSINSD